MRTLCGWVIFFLFCLHQTSTKPLLDPALKSLLSTKAVSHCEVLVKFRGPLTKSIWNSKFINRPDQALTLLKEKFSSDLELNKLEIKKIYWLNRSILINLDMNQLQQLQSRSDVNYVSLNREFALSESDARKKVSNNLIKDSEAISHALKTLQIPQVWNQIKLKGQSRRIGFIGRGFSSHPDLNSEMITYRNFSSNIKTSVIEDNDTELLGLMGAGSLSGRLLGVAPEARFYVADVFDDQNKTKLSIILDALQWIINPDSNPNTEDGAEIITHSWGYVRGPMGAEKPLWDATIALRKMNIINIFPAGDKGSKTSSLESPASYPHVISVGAVDRQLNEAIYSSRGPSKWENVSYSKPDFLAPASQVESLLPGTIYGRINGTKAAAALMAASLTLIKQSNPQLPWKEILKITNQSSFSKHDRVRIPQIYDASILARYGAKISIQIDGPSNESCKIILLDENKSFVASSMGYAEFYLKKGSYRVAYTAEGYAPKISKINVIPKQNQQLTIKLEKAKIFNFDVKAYNSKNKRIPAIVELLGEIGQKFIGVTQSLNEALPEGIYPVKISSRGYKSISTSIIHTESNQNHRYKFNVMPLVAVVNQDHNSQTLTAQTLQQIGLEYDLLHSLKSFDEIEAYQTIIWEADNTLNHIINQKQQLLLVKYLRHGGSLLLTGQDLAYWLQSTLFLDKILGVDFEQDHSSSLD